MWFCCDKFLTRSGRAKRQCQVSFVPTIAEMINNITGVTKHFFFYKKRTKHFTCSVFFLLTLVLSLIPSGFLQKTPSGPLADCNFRFCCVNYCLLYSATYFTITTECFLLALCRSLLQQKEFCLPMGSCFFR